VLELLSSGSATTVCLIRTTTFGKVVETHCVAMGLCWISELVDSSVPSRTEGRQSERSTSQRDSGPDELNRSFQTRIVHCEICVPSDSVPSFEFRDAKVSVSRLFKTPVETDNVWYSTRYLSSPSVTLASFLPHSPNSLQFLFRSQAPPPALKDASLKRRPISLHQNCCSWRWHTINPVRCPKNRFCYIRPICPASNYH
jgi:hypothetical protein